MTPPASRDRWAQWHANRRFGGDPDVRQRFLSNLAATRDRVLDRAALSAGERLLDVGCGEGLIAFGALERGASVVTFSDISADLLDFCRRAATDLGVMERCEFVQAPADDLVPISDASVDVVTTRSVLIYVKDKSRAFTEFARVLRPGGRISIFEPINRFAQNPESASFAGYDLGGLGDISTKLRGLFETIQDPNADPMLDFDERDLIRLAEAAGFFPINLTLEAVVEPTPPRDWDGFLDSSGNPNLPTVREAMQETLTVPEQERLAAHLRPLVEGGLGVWRMASAFLSATRRAAAQLDDAQYWTS
jgi:SAM-dependent methyltransferase